MIAANTLPLVSLIIPTYNRCTLLRQAVASALVQTYPALEIIVVDDGSTDGTLEWLASYTGQITVIQQANQGVAAARNHGFHHAHGEYLTFLDDDDLIAPTKIARQVAFFNRHPNTGLVYSGYAKGDSHGRTLENIWLRPPTDDILAQLVRGNFIWMGGPLIRRQWLEQVGGFDASPERDLHSCADWDLWLRLALAGCPFAAVPEPLGMYRLQPDSMVTNLAQLERELVTVLRLTWEHPALPTRLAAAKPAACAEVHLWLSARGFAEGQDTGRCHLAAALRERPDWCEQPETLLVLLRGHALDARITDPPQFVTDLFDHLPAEAEFLRPHHPWLLAYAHLGLALRQLAMGSVMQAKAGFAAALRIYPALAQQPEQVAPFITQYALSLPAAEPVWFAGAALTQLPFSARSTRGDVALGWAFQAYAAEAWRDVPRRVLRAWWYRPALLKNRGAWAILLKSLRRERGKR